MPEQQPVSAPSLQTRVKWALFRVLEWAANLRAGHLSAADPSTSISPSGSTAGAGGRLWVFVSTIGEVNAIEPFLRAFLAESGNPPLLLLSDHEHYRDSYLAKFPAAEFVRLDGGTADALKLLRTFPPRALIIGEIPCLLQDAPCRLSFAMIYELKRRGIPVCLVNGWLYHYVPASRLDAIERWLFDRAYVRLIDTFLVQTEDVKRHLIAHGAEAGQIAVVGNIKFDAMVKGAWSPEHARSPALLHSLVDSGRPCIVAGCVTEFEDQRAILDAYRKVLTAVPRAFLVLAPRHPEVKERMEKLESFLKQETFRHVFRSRLDGARLEPDTQVLVLDTMGELKDFYAAATLTFVGTDHNVLEPLAFDKPVFVKPGWVATYPSYPVYCLLLEHQALIEVANESELANRWIELLRNPNLYGAQRQRIESVLARERGASERSLGELAARGWLRRRGPHARQ